MKFLKLTTLLIISLSLTASGQGLSETLEQLSSDDYGDRQPARTELYAMASSATAADAESGELVAFENAIAAELEKPDKDLQTRIFLIRLLQGAGTERSAPLLLSLSMDAEADPQVRGHARMALAAIHGEGVSDSIVKGLQNAAEAERPAWWQVLAYHQDTAATAAAINLIRSGNLPLQADAISAIGRSGGTEGADFLYERLQKRPEQFVINLEQALLRTGQMNDAQLAQLISRSKHSNTRLAAFDQIVTRNNTIAQEILLSQLQQPGNELAPLFLRRALATTEDWAWEAALLQLGTLHGNAVAIVLAAIGEQGLAAQEPLLIEYATSVDAQVQQVALQALAQVATKTSVATLMQLIKSDDKDTRELAEYALVQVDDPELDRDLVEQVMDATNPDREEIIRLLAIRNGEGAVETLYSLLFEAESNPGVRDALLASIKEIGDLNSCRSIALSILQQPGNQSTRDYQLLLKRLILRLAIPDMVWEQVFQPALQLAPSDDARARLIEILDSISNDSALEYCLDILSSGDNELLTQACNRVIRRWTQLNIGDYWVEQLLDEETGEPHKQIALSEITRLIGSVTVDADNNQKATFAIDTVLELTDEDHIRTIVEATLDSGAKGAFNRQLNAYRINRQLNAYRKVLDIRDATERNKPGQES